MPRRPLPGRKAFAAFFGLLSLAAGAKCFADDKVLLKVVLNTVERGDYFLVLTDDGDALVPTTFLTEMGIHMPGKAPAESSSGLLSLRSLSPDLSFALDEANATLDITVNPSLLEKQVVDMATHKRDGVLYSSDSTAFLDYSVTYVGGQKSASVPLQLAARVGPVLLLTDADVVAGPAPSFTRNMTSLIMDDTTAMRRLSLGDFVAGFDSQGLGSSLVLGGLGLSKTFFLDPFFIKSPDVVIADSLAAPGTVKMAIGKTSLGGERQFSPGPFQFLNVPLPPGASVVTVTITEAGGAVRTLQIPYYRSTQLLAPGVDEYSYDLGFARQGLGTESFAYGDPVFLGYHRVGLTNWLTAGLRAEAAPGLLNGGPSATVTLGMLGELSTSASLSVDHGVTGFAAAADYSYLGPVLSAGISGRYFSRDYATVVPAADTRPMMEATARMGIRGKLLGSLAVSATYSVMEDQSAREVFSASYSRQIFKTLELQALFTGQMQAGAFQYSGLAALRLVLGDTLGSVGYTINDGKSEAAARVQKNAGRGTSLGYNLGVAETQDDVGAWVLSGDGALQLNWAWGEYQVNAAYSLADRKLLWGFDAAGSVVLADSSVFLAGPIRDSFAVVSLDGLAGVRVKAGNEYVGTTDRSGRLVVPGLVSYNENQLAIEPADVPLNYSAPVTERYVSPPYRGGAVVRFQAKRFQAVTGRLFFVEGGVQTAAEYAALQVTVDGATVESVVGQGGEFYLENLPEGSYAAHIVLDKREASFTLVVPRSAQALVDLGDIACPVQEGG